MSVASTARTSQVAFAGAPPLAAPIVSDTRKEPRSWQIPRQFSGRYILGWLTTNELCHGLCSRGCTTSFHKENAELWTNKSMEAHIWFLRQDVGVFVTDKFDLDCVGERVVYIDRARTRVSWAIVVSDSGGESPGKRRVPLPKLVDKIKRFLNTEEEPCWFKAVG